MKKFTHTTLTQTTVKAVNATINENKITKHSAGGSCDNMLTVVELPDVLTHVRAPDTGMALDIHVVPKSKENL